MASVSLDAARAHHARRALEAAMEHGAALLDALRLPRLVEADFAPLGREAIGEALDLAVEILDAIDAATEDLEPDEAEPEAGYDLPEGDDELDGAGDVDAEPSIGWPEDFLARFDPRLALESQADCEADDADMEPDGERMAVRRTLGLNEPTAGQMVARAKAIRNGTALPDDGFNRSWLAADRVFGLHVEGDCCAPEILNHGTVHVDKEATPEVGDFVALWFEAERAGRRVLIAWVKRLAMGLPRGTSFPFHNAPGNELFPVLMIESLNPPRRYTIDVRRVHALFKVVAVIPPAEAIAARQRMADARR